MGLCVREVLEIKIREELGKTQEYTIQGKDPDRMKENR